jgi:hypothetical protein
MKHTTPRIIYRYVAGRPLDGRTGYPYLSRGPARWPGWRRQLVRLTIPAASFVTLHDPQTVAAAASVVGTVVLYQVRRRWSRRRFRREYVTPTLAAISAPLGGVRVRLHVDPGLGSLTPRLATPLSPAEQAARLWYGERVEPALRWPADTAMRAWWALQRAAAPLTDRLTVLRRPAAEQLGPRIELTVAAPYLSSEQRSLVSSIIHAKIPAGELVESWDQVGAQVTGRWVVRRRPPTRVGVEELLAAMPQLQEWEFFLGQTTGARPVVLSLTDDSPHIAVSAGTGAGKSVLAQLVAVQVLARGGRVIILDRKGSHRWALGLAGVDYCLKPAQMHDALIRAAAVADQRNTDALYEADDWDPGPRTLIICEELNATIGQLTTYWADTRAKDEPKRSPGGRRAGRPAVHGPHREVQRDRDRADADRPRDRRPGGAGELRDPLPRPVHHERVEDARARGGRCPGRAARSAGGRSSSAGRRPSVRSRTSPARRPAPLRSRTCPRKTLKAR